MADPKRISLALQGGGAHGAFTWGVLERLLEDERIEIAGISGTSARALNGAAVKAGLVTGGRQAALDNLEWLWTRIGAITEPAFAPWFDLVAPVAVSAAMEASLSFAVGDGLSRVLSPYASGPFYSHPLRAIAERM